MAWVEVQRVSDKKSNHLTPFEVLIDENVVGQLAPGESKAFEVAPGPHEIYSRISWCRSEKVDIQLQVDQKLTFRCQTRAKNFLTDGYWATFGRARYLILRQVASEALRTDIPSAHAGHPTLGRSRVSASQQGVVPHNRERSVRRCAILEAVRNRKPVAAVLLLIGVGALLFGATRGLEFLAAISILYIGAQTVVAINFHLLTPKAADRLPVKSHRPFGFHGVQETIISVAFAVVGMATLSGILDTGQLAGWLALGAAAAGGTNILTTRRGTSAGYPETH